MKIKPEHLQHIKTAIDKVLADYPGLVAEYEHGQFSRSDRVKNLQLRFCYDLAYGAGLNQWICDTLYPYMNDEHLYTALKQVCPKVTRQY